MISAWLYAWSGCVGSVDIDRAVAALQCRRRDGVRRLFGVVAVAVVA